MQYLDQRIKMFHVLVNWCEAHKSGQKTQSLGFGSIIFVFMHGGAVVSALDLGSSG